MKNEYSIKGTTLAIGNLTATLLIEGTTSFSTITFNKELLEKYVEDYIKTNFEISEDGWIRRLENEEI